MKQSKSTVHLVVDLETVNTTSWKPAIFQVGIAAVLPDGRKHYWQGTCRYSMLAVDTATWNWWQHPERLGLFNFINKPDKHKFANQEILLTEATNFIRLLKANHDIMVWGNSPTFDLVPFHVLLGSSNLPWTYRDERDLRTVFALKPWEGLAKELSTNYKHYNLCDQLNATLGVDYQAEYLVRHNAVYDAALELENLMYVAPMLNLVLAERA